MYELHYELVSTFLSVIFLSPSCVSLL